MCSHGCQVDAGFFFFFLTGGLSSSPYGPLSRVVCLNVLMTSSRLPSCTPPLGYMAQPYSVWTGPYRTMNTRGQESMELSWGPFCKLAVAVVISFIVLTENIAVSWNHFQLT